MTQTSQPVPASEQRDLIKQIFLAHGFTVKDGHVDLKPYVYEAAEALLAAISQQAAAEPVAYADPQAFRNFRAKTCSREWMWANPDQGLVPLYRITPPAQAPVQQIKDHIIAQTVNELRDIAIKFHGAQQLRERIAYVIVPLLKAAPVQPVQQEAPSAPIDRNVIAHEVRQMLYQGYSIGVNHYGDPLLLKDGETVAIIKEALRKNSWPTLAPVAQPVQQEAQESTREADVSHVGRDLEGMPQPYAGAIVLLETIAECGALAFYSDATRTPNSKLCKHFANELRRAGAAARQPQEPAATVQLVAPFGLRGSHIKATMRHDAGAYARCHYCGRYSDDLRALRHDDFQCDCGKKNGWSGSFAAPTPESKWHGEEPAAQKQARSDLVAPQPQSPQAEPQAMQSPQAAQTERDDKTEGWLIEWRDTNGHRKAVHGHNAVADYRAMHEGVTVTELVRRAALPRPSEAEIRARALEEAQEAAGYSGLLPQNEIERAYMCGREEAAEDIAALSHQPAQADGQKGSAA